MGFVALYLTLRNGKSNRMLRPFGLFWLKEVGMLPVVWEGWHDEKGEGEAVWLKAAFD
jgi:hypothetical protein